MSERFYVNWPLQPGPVVIEGPEAHHLAAVCRLRPGDLVCLFNGDGRQYPARISAIDRRQVTLEVETVETPERELGFRIEVAAPLPKGDRAQFLIEKLTELGVASFIPLQTARSVVHPREARRLERWVIEASKQCGRNVLLQIEPLASWEEYCVREGLPERRILAHPGGEAERRRFGDAPTAMALAVGPEGGFTEEEVARGLAAGWQAIDLGPRILRVETAAIVLTADCLFAGP